MIEVSKIIKKCKNELETAGIECSINYKGINDDDEAKITVNDDDDKNDDQSIFKFGRNESFSFNFSPIKNKIEDEGKVDSSKNDKQVMNSMVSSENKNKSESDLVKNITQVESSVASLENKAKPEIEVDSAKNKNVEQIEFSFICWPKAKI